MKLTRLIPNIFYSDIRVGLNLFVDCLGFKVVYSDSKAPQPIYIIKRDELVIHLLENDEFAKKDRPSIRVETDNIEEYYQEIKNKNMDLFHPNLATVKLQPWGLWEFAVADKTSTCVIVHQDAGTL